MKSRYKTNLPELQSICSMNYAKLGKLMPDAQSSDSWMYRASNNAEHKLKIKITDRAPYTTTIMIEQSGNISPWLQQISLGVRIYHDAMMAEVTEWQRHRRWLGRYEYPNKSMYQMDEKSQLNQFLSDWLGLCLAQGHSLDNSYFTKTGEQI